MPAGTAHSTTASSSGSSAVAMVTLWPTAESTADVWRVPETPSRMP